LRKERDGSVSFGNDDSARIIGKGTVRIGNGHKLMFDSQKCEIRKEGSGKLIATVVRTSSNIYVLSEIGNEKCCLGKEDEVWLWHKRMGHINFDNLVKVKKRKQSEKFPRS
jgi:hypothetical protein